MFIWVENILRILFMLLDAIVVILGSLLYDLLILIADTNIFGDTATKLGERVYALLGIFMLFSLSFSVITYIVNPDKMTDSKQGMGKIIQKVMIVFVLIITVPWIFKQAMRLQGIILSNNVIPSLFLDVNLEAGYGDGTGESYKEWDLRDNQGERIMYSVYSAFLQPNYEDITEFTVCPDFWSISTASDECYNYLNDEFPDVRKEVFAGTSKTNSKLPFNIVNMAVYTSYEGKHHLFDYKYIIGTACAGFVVYVFFLSTIDVAKRSVKIGFLQIVSPVPIMSLLSPNQDMSSGTFKKWYSTCIKTYLELFIRLAAIFFGIFLINQVNAPNSWESFSELEGQVDAIRSNWLLPIFMIIGILQFVKSLPKLIEELFGGGMGGFTLDPRKKFGSTPLIGGTMVAGGTLAANAALAGGRGIVTGGRYLGNRAIGRKDKADQVWNAGKQKIRDRMTTATDVARGQIDTGGMLGSENYDDTVHSRRAKERKELNTKATEGKRANIELEDAKNKGRKAYENQRQNVIDGKSKYDIYSSNVFASSAKELDVAKGEMYAAENELTKVQLAYQQGKITKEEYTEKAKIAGATKGRVTLLEKMHENVRKQYQSDAEIEDSLKSYLASSGNKPVSNKKEDVLISIEREKGQIKNIDNNIAIAEEFIKETKNSGLNKKEKKELINQFKSEIKDYDNKKKNI